MKSCMIVPWFGVYPKIYHLTMRTAARQGIDKLFIIGDQPPKLYDNIQYIPMTLDDISNRIRKIIPNFPNLEVPYKLCDIKPMYAYIFEDIISEYDCFMFTDLDNMFGDYEYILKIIHKFSGNIDAIPQHNMFGGNFQWLNMKYIRNKKPQWIDYFKSDEYTIRAFDIKNYRNLDEGNYGNVFQRIGGISATEVGVGFHDDWKSIIYYNGKKLYSITKFIEIYSHHIYFIYKWKPIEDLPLSTFESNSILMNRMKWDKNKEVNPLVENLEE